MTAGWSVLLILLGLWPGAGHPGDAGAALRASENQRVVPLGVISAQRFEQEQRQTIAVERSA